MGSPTRLFSFSLAAFLDFPCPRTRSFPLVHTQSLLSGLIYIQRLLFLELALPLRDYPALHVERRPRRNQLRRLERIRGLYMVTDAQSPFEEMVSLRSYGRVIARTDSPAFVLRWSEDAQTLFQGVDLELSMGSFRWLPAYFIEQAEHLCDELMFRWRPTIDLTKVKDDLTSVSPGSDRAPALQVSGLHTAAGSK